VDEKNLCVLFPAARKGLNPSEITIAEVLKFINAKPAGWITLRRAF
jgi:SpoU rRNA methylase family enzyme